MMGYIGKSLRMIFSQKKNSKMVDSMETKSIVGPKLKIKNQGGCQNVSFWLFSDFSFSIFCVYVSDRLEVK